MNNPNPLLPQGALVPKAKSTLYFKILMIVAVHVVLLGGLLVEGCKDTSKTSATPKSDVAEAPAKDPMSATPPDFATAPAANNTPAAAPALPITPPVTAATLPPPPGATMPAVNPIPATIPAGPAVGTASTVTGPGVYVIASGDMLSTIAKKAGVSVKAIEEANPGLDPKKLQIGHKLQIPAASAIASTSVSGTAAGSTADATPAPAGDSTLYVVKSGDVLMKIARAHGTSVKALEALNDMKTSNIKAGQKLKVPVMKMASADATPAPAPAPAVPASTLATPAPAVRAN